MQAEDRAEFEADKVKVVFTTVLGSSERAAKLLNHICYRTGLLLERRPNVLGFAHLTFQEYLAAMAIHEGNRLGVDADLKGRDINVAVLDTGVYAAHSALGDRVKDFVVIDPLGRRITASPPFDADQHGTHVCGTIAGSQTADGISIGVAPQANLFVAGVLVGDCTLSTLVEGISWAIEQGADIINMSLGLTYYEPLFAEILEILLNQYGILPVVAIGNENHGNSSSPGNTYLSEQLKRQAQTIWMSPFLAVEPVWFFQDKNPII